MALIIFDFDGVIVDSERKKFNVVKDVAKSIMSLFQMKGMSNSLVKSEDVFLKKLLTAQLLTR